MLKILHICQRDDPSTGGALRVAEALVREQRRAGHDAWMLFLYGPPGELFKELSPSAVCLGISSSRQVFRGMVLLRRTVRRIAPDLIHSHDGILWPRLVYLRRNAPVITHGHLPPGAMSSLKERIGWPLTKRTTDRLIGISQHTMDAWLAAGYSGRPLPVIPNGVDFERFSTPSQNEKSAIREQLGLPKNKRLVVWVGRVHCATKGTDRVEQVVVMLPDDTALVVVGDGPDYAGMHGRCRSAVETGKLFMPGSVYDSDTYYRAADAFLFTSYAEPFGLVILEAVASGLPLMAFPVTRGGGATELLQEFEATMLEDGPTPETIAKGFDRVFLRREEDAQRLRARAKERYAWPAISDRVVQVYEDLLTEWRRRR